jgi:hypothetical protein
MLRFSEQRLELLQQGSVWMCWELCSMFLCWCEHFKVLSKSLQWVWLRKLTDSFTL